MSVGRLGGGLHYRRRVKTPRREFQHRCHLVPRDVKPVHHLADIRSRFQVFKHERNRRPGVPGFSENTLLRYRAGAG